MKTVIIFCNTSWNIYNFRQKLICELKKKYNVIIIAGKDDYSDKVKNISRSYFLNLKNRSINPFKNFNEILNLKKIINNYPNSTIINFTNKSIILGTFAIFFTRIRAINVVTGLGHAYLQNNFFIKFIIKFIYLLVNLRSDFIVVQNKYDKIYFQNQLFTNNKVKLIYGSGVDTKKFVPNNKIKKKSKIFLFFGRVLKEKGILNFLQAANYFKKNNSIIFKVVGDLNEENFSDIDRKQIKKLLKLKNVEFIKFNESILSIINYCDCVILPSYREGFSKSLLEATAMKKFVICTDVPGCNEIIKNNYNGFLFKKRDTSDLILKINKYLKLPKKKIKKMEINSRKRTLKLFSDEIVIEKYLKLI